MMMNPLDLLAPDMRKLFMEAAKAELLAEGKAPVKEPAKPRKLTPKQEQQKRVGVMTARWKYRDYQAWIKQHQAEIEEIQKEIPGWLPTPPGTSNNITFNENTNEHKN